MFTAISRFDQSVLQWIQKHLRCGFLDAVMPWITRFGEAGIFWIAVTLFLLCRRRTRRTGLSMALAILIGFIVGNLILKNAFARVRPYDVDQTVQLLINRLSDYSFPSGHTLVSFEAATVLAARRTKWGIPALVLAVLVAFSRLYLFVHYPTDVLAGTVLGVGFGFLGCFLGDRISDATDKRHMRISRL